MKGRARRWRRPARASKMNPMLEEYRKVSWPHDMGRLLDADYDPARRALLWMALEKANAIRRRFAWAIPDDRAIGILRSFSPIVEIAAGRGYWCSLVERSGGEATAFDRAPPRRTFATVRVGGPKVLKSCGRKTLFLCYPDEDDDEMATPDDEATSLQCLVAFRGDTVVLAGETLISGGTLSLSQAPWGRCFDSEFQVALAERYHCVLVADLPRWPHATDAISVWRRTRVCPVLWPSSEEGGEEKDEWADIPPDERLVFSLAAPCAQHLLRS